MMRRVVAVWALLVMAVVASAQDPLAAATDAYRQGDFPKAAKLFAEAAEAETTPAARAEIRVKLAWTYYAMKNRTRADEALAAALTDNPGLEVMRDYYTDDFLALVEKVRKRQASGTPATRPTSPPSRSDPASGRGQHGGAAPAPRPGDRPDGGGGRARRPGDPRDDVPRPAAPRGPGAQGGGSWIDWVAPARRWSCAAALAPFAPQARRSRHLGRPPRHPAGGSSLPRLGARRRCSRVVARGACCPALVRPGDRGPGRGAGRGGPPRRGIRMPCAPR